MAHPEGSGLDAVSVANARPHAILASVSSKDWWDCFSPGKLTKG
jgi:hypothetical protein